MKTRIICGIYLIASAIVLMLYGTGVINGIPLLKLAFPVLLVPVVISGITDGGFIRILLPICLTVITFSKELGLSSISPFVMIVATFFLAVGLNTLVPKKRNFAKVSKSTEAYSASDDDNIKIGSRFGGVEKYIESENFTSASIECSCSGVSLFLDKAVMNPEGAVINIDARCSGIELCLPRTWQVIDKLDCSMSGVTIPKNEESPLKLMLCGRVSLCGVTVKFI